ncbi:forkhead box protein O isoform X3 [Cryptotermes secundus]|uniref:forkhead box protein O isoform X3 n=1 Tax=Cryptotermes secundus TaxID=105785 RepID=UPI001454D650|nr:forkhead box protein O isoform X3 [Cryptotermes secundus]
MTAVRLGSVKVRLQRGGGFVVTSVDPTSLKATKEENSIRHNLSLHNRFMRVQNEGTGKSSWWMINPDAKPGKSARRRATSMETSKFEKRRGRVKKKVEALRNGLQAATDATPSPSSSISEGLDMFPGSPAVATASFQLSPDFRPRASSNASSCGRMSPFRPVPVETEWATYSTASGFGPEQLAGNLAESMKLHQGGEFLQGYGGSNGQQPPPPPPPYEFGARQQLHAASPYGLSQCHLHRMQPCSCHLQHSPSYPQSDSSPDPLRGQPVPQGAQFGPPRALSSRDTDSRPGTPTPSTMMGQLMGALNNNALLDDLNLNIETLHGGFDCNVEEVIKHELSMDGSLDFNFSQHHHHHHPGGHQAPPGAQELQQGVGAQQPATPYSTTVSTGPSWVH